MYINEWNKNELKEKVYILPDKDDLPPGPCLTKTVDTAGWLMACLAVIIFFSYLCTIKGKSQGSIQHKYVSSFEKRSHIESC